MIKGIDTIQHNVQLVQKRQEITSGNLANANTSGYQAARAFQSTLKEVQFHNYQGGKNGGNRLEVGSLPYGNQLDTVQYDTSRGSITQTGRDTDFSVAQDGYFTIQLPDGTNAYTRNGNFKLNTQNQYITQENYLVLNNQNQPVTKDQWQTFQINRIDDQAVLQSQGYTYKQTANVQRITADIRQGSLENSNVSMTDEMIAMLQQSREYEGNQKVLSTLNETLKKATSEFARM